jgi:eukaryotic-like serine/threonine-protein kinase
MLEYLKMRWKCLLILVFALYWNLVCQGSDWPVFRGNHQQTGVTAAKLPEQMAPVWTYALEGGIEATAAITGNTVYVGSLGGSFVAIDLASGKEKWKYKASDEIKSSPAVDKQTVYFGDEKGTLHALNANSGQKKFSFQAEAGITASPVIFQDHILIGSYDQNLYCLKPDGSVHWKVETEGYIHGTPAIWNGNAVIAGCDGFLRVIQITDGSEKQKIKLGAYVGASPSVSEERLFVGTFGNTVLGVDLKQGKILWQYENPDARFPFYSSPAVLDKKVFLGGRDKFFHALDTQTGKEVWKFPAKSRVESSPVISGNTIYFGTVGGQVYGLAANTGKVVWQYDAAEAVLASPAIVDGKMVIGTQGGTLYCFGQRRAS